MGWVGPVAGVLAVIGATYNFTVLYISFTEKMDLSISLGEECKARLDVMQPQLTGLNVVFNRDFCKGCK